MAYWLPIANNTILGLNLMHGHHKAIEVPWCTGVPQDPQLLNRMGKWIANGGTVELGGAHWAPYAHGIHWQLFSIPNGKIHPYSVQYIVSMDLHVLSVFLWVSSAFQRHSGKLIGHNLYSMYMRDLRIIVGSLMKGTDVNVQYCVNCCCQCILGSKVCSTDSVLVVGLKWRTTSSGQKIVSPDLNCW